MLEASIQWNCTTVLNILFLALSAVLVWRFLRTGGPEMLRMMGASKGGAEDGGAKDGGARHAHHHGS